MSVKSTYNFVPAPTESEVYKPHWAEQVSHDIPFSDGESGEIEIEITAETPIFIREGISTTEAKNKQDKGTAFDFSHYYDGDGNKHYFIPATSLKGMIRSNVEILSFSRMQQIDETKIFGLRDMNNNDYKSETNLKNLKSGWLIFDNGKWSIKGCESDRVSISSIVSTLRPSKIVNGVDIIEYRKAKAKEKYIALGKKDFNHLNNFAFSHHVDKTGDIYELKDSGSDNSGNLVLFGSMDNKKYDYVFYEPSDDSEFQLETFVDEKSNKTKCKLLERMYPPDQPHLV